MIRDLSDPEEYRKLMSYPLTFDVGAITDNYEEYVMQIVAKDDSQAEIVADILCNSLGLKLSFCRLHET